VQNSYPDSFESFGVMGSGIGEPPLSSDGVFDKNKLPPISETNVIGELLLTVGNGLDEIDLVINGFLLQ
jgi:hypothetical protein